MDWIDCLRSFRPADISGSLLHSLSSFSDMSWRSLSVCAEADVGDLAEVDLS